MKIQFSPGILITAGDLFADKHQIHPNVSVLSKSDGYDGQFHYRLALDPMTTKEKDFGVTLDNPPFRQKRIMYPFLAWAFSFGRPDGAPTALLLVNLLALLAIAYVGSVYANNVGRHALWGLPISFYAGFLFVLSRDLTEIVETFFLLVALLFLQKRRLILSALFFLFTLLTKESFLLPLLVISFVGLFQKRKQWEVLLVPIILYMAWNIYLYFAWKGQWLPWSPDHYHAGIPFVGMFDAIRSRIFQPLQLSYLWELEMVSFWSIVITTGACLRISAAPWYIKLSWAVLAVSWVTPFGPTVQDDMALMRIFSQFYLLNVIILLQSKKPAALLTLGSQGVVWILLARDIIMYRL